MQTEEPAVSGDEGHVGALLMIFMRIELGFEDEIARWYDEEHIPEKLRADGVLTVRRYVSDTEPRHLTIYELMDARVVQHPDFKQPSTPWTDRLRDHFTIESRIVCPTGD